METIFNYDPKYLSNQIIESLGFIKGIALKNDYVIDNEKNFAKLFEYKYLEKLRNASLKTKKMLVHNMIRLQRKGNLHACNLFIHFLRKRVLGQNESGYYESTTPAVKIRPSVKEQTIQRKRAEWKKLRDQAEKALQSYKKEKGNFYKKQIKEHIMEAA